MRRHKWELALALGIIVGVFAGCSFNLTTANIRSVKISKDEDGKQEATTFGPGEKVYVVAEIANNVGKVKVRFRVLYDDVEGKETGAPVSGAEKTLDVEGSRPAIFWLTLPKESFANGRYKAEVTMLAENGDQKGQTTAAFSVEGFSAGINKGPSSNGEPQDPALEKTSANETTETIAHSFGNGSFEGFCRNKISGQRARLSFELTRAGNEISGSAFVGPPLRGSGVVTGTVDGNHIELLLETRDVRENWSIRIYGDRTPGGGFEGTYRISDGQYGVFTVNPVGD
ncbi:MAG: hypothetical protein ACXW3F_12755 [Pyrinomonadaceae bacterium]